MAIQLQLIDATDHRRRLQQLARAIQTAQQKGGDLQQRPHTSANAEPEMRRKATG